MNIDLSLLHLYFASALSLFLGPVVAEILFAA